MIKEIKYLFFLLVIFLCIFFTAKYYFSDSHKKKSFRSLSSINEKIDIYAKKLPILNSDTRNIIEYVKNTQTKKKKKYNFWDLLGKNE